MGLFHPQRHFVGFGQPKMPPSWPVGEETQRREPDEVPRTGPGERLTAHHLRHGADRPSDDQSRPRWEE
ncbi:DUF6479 family protein [Streptomyces sp. NPDC001177]